MTDLTKNKEAFGLMDKADRDAMRALPIDQVEQYVCCRWEPKPPDTDFCYDLTYRQNPEPPKPVIETRSGECWVGAYARSCPAIYDKFVGDVLHGTYRQTTIDGKPVRITWVADGHTPTLTDEQVDDVCRLLSPVFVLGGNRRKDDIRDEAYKWFDAFGKAGVM